MKIIGLRFANLNSLEGEWVIDFTRPEYVSDGIFAIIGPTGSGKSTILDALCLALYGQTPRLGKITRSSNEIMSRHAGECFAEATFSTAKGTFRCHWSQHRSRRRAGGELQAQKHELSDAAGNILQTKVQDTLAAVEEFTGMDFERFTRSMLLAQGGFAAFLEADPDHRAPVLEQITGTEVYSAISMRVHERQRAERSTLDLLRVESGGIRVFGEDELASLRVRLEQLVESERAGQLQLENLSSALRRLEEIGRLEAELAGIEAQRSDLDDELAAFAPQETRLALARLAESLARRYVPLELQRQELVREIAELALNVERRAILDSETKRSVLLHASADEACRSAAAASAAARPLHEQVMALDRQVAEKSRLLQMRQEAFDAADSQLAGLGAERSAIEGKLVVARKELMELQEWLDANRADAGLETSLSGMRHAWQELRVSSGRQVEADAAAAGARSHMEACIEAKASIEPAAAASGVCFAEADQVLARLRQEAEELLAGKTNKALRLELDASRERGQLLDGIAALYASGREFATKIDVVDAAIRELLSRKSLAGERLGPALQLLQGAEREVALCEANQLLAARVMSYEEDRLRLAEGLPCPLCGSTSHPYASGLPAGTDDVDVPLRQAKDSMHSHASTLQDIEKSILECDTALGQHELRRMELDRERGVYARRCLELLAGAGIASHVREAEPEILQERDAAHENTARLANLVEAADSLDERTRQAESFRQVLLDACIADTRSLEQAGERVAASAAELRRLEEAQAAARNDLEARTEKLKVLLSPFGATLPSDGDAARLIDQLASRSERWRSGEERTRSLREGIISLESACERMLVQSEALFRDRLVKQEEVKVAERDLAGLVLQRSDLFGERDPAEEEARLAEASDDARLLLDRARDEMGRAQQELGILETALATLQSGIAVRRSAVGELQSGFIAELQANGFTDEQAFLAFRLSDGEREHLEREAGELQNRKRELHARSEDRKQRLRQEQAARLDNRVADELADGIRKLRERLGALLEEVGVIRRQLADNEQAASEQREKALAIEAQSAECRRWDLLHELIGSADGKKFRNFAQGMTFELMVSCANRQLVLMTDRYLLVRDPESPLELNVVDTWQAGEVRSTRNLSGGESFIVSLALALGLSQMSSRNVRVDSLFLDEGFGTLDEDALETALETLAGLQQSGKLIGIISHVPALRERISTQIRVAPLTGGRSAISGPGISRR